MLILEEDLCTEKQEACSIFKGNTTKIFWIGIGLNMALAFTEVVVDPPIIQRHCSLTQSTI